MRKKITVIIIMNQIYFPLILDMVLGPLLILEQYPEQTLLLCYRGEEMASMVKKEENMKIIIGKRMKKERQETEKRKRREALVQIKKRK